MANPVVLILPIEAAAGTGPDIEFQQTSGSAEVMGAAGGTSEAPGASGSAETGFTAGTSSEI